MKQNKKSGSEIAVSAAAASLGVEPASSIADDTTNNSACQFSEESELKARFQPRKEILYLLANSYSRLGEEKKSLRVRDCGSSLFFSHEIDSDGVIDNHGKLSLANFCKDRLCPMCNWRRSRKIFGQVSQVVDSLQKDYQFLFLTLTVPNVSADDLSDTLDHMLKALNRMFHRKRIQYSVKGFFRALEITYNLVRNDFHPHFHIILAVNKSYFQKAFYISHAEWLNIWNECYYGKDYKSNADIQIITQVDIRKAYDKTGGRDVASFVAESAKYAVKSSSYLHGDDFDTTDRLVSFFADVLYHRRLVHYGGVMLEQFKRLGLDDAESYSADLVHVNESINTALARLIRHYGWNVGIGNYQFLTSYVEEGKS